MTYFFLGNLSFLEIGYTTNIFPCMLASFFDEANSISFSAGMAQFYLFGSLGGSECLLLSMMSYDRYLAICNPLHYADVLSGQVSLCLAAASWIGGFLITLVTILFMVTLTFCGRNEIDHFFCDFTPLLKLSCSDTYLFKKVSFFLSSTLTLVPFLLTMVSYIYILSAILNRLSTAGSQKAISTCSSHLIVVITFYGTLIAMYVVPAADHSLDLNKVFSIFYNMVTPMSLPEVLENKARSVLENKERSEMTSLPGKETKDGGGETGHDCEWAAGSNGLQTGVRAPQRVPEIIPGGRGSRSAAGRHSTVFFFSGSSAHIHRLRQVFQSSSAGGASAAGLPVFTLGSEDRKTCCRRAAGGRRLEDLPQAVDVCRAAAEEKNGGVPSSSAPASAPPLG
ncbi:LOW QUALITY PROTEIN: olfactory receptor 6B1-like [Dermochelys coriacea]|uniref:LOW QUALITY PROTEIN: olfactory receptor 6B1-like n=1 Tax=Dermochelys coriacea TaxID=27794 RepID=UPI001CA85C44|nr:LOW QUALITY PROTEIN: olfactory receptor 6B1-like [Dermochelys coriacea]